MIARKFQVFIVYFGSTYRGVLAKHVVSLKTEAATGLVLQEKVFLGISQNSQENSCTRVSFLIKLKKRLLHRCFPVNFVKFLRTSFLQNTSGQLLLYKDLCDDVC